MPLSATPRIRSWQSREQRGAARTSVALHRIAYLLYHDRKNLKSSNILILSPNSVFADYISHILPELGRRTSGK